MWFIGSVIGSISLVILNTLSKLLHFNTINSIMMGLLSVFTTYCFWYAWQNSPKSFLSVWFLQSGLVMGLAFVANAYIGEHVSIKDLIYVLLIVGGIVGLKWG